MTNNYYLDNDQLDLIPAFYSWDDDSFYERKTKKDDIERNIQDFILLCDNSYSDTHEKLRSYIIPEVCFLPRKLHRVASISEVEDFRQKNEDVLNKFYQYYYETKERVSNASDKAKVLVK